MIDLQKTRIVSLMSSTRDIYCIAGWEKAISIFEKLFRCHTPKSFISLSMIDDLTRQMNIGYQAVVLISTGKLIVRVRDMKEMDTLYNQSQPHKAIANLSIFDFIMLLFAFIRYKLPDKIGNVVSLMLFHLSS